MRSKGAVPRRSRGATPAGVLSAVRVRGSLPGTTKMTTARPLLVVGMLGGVSDPPSASALVPIVGCMMQSRDDNGWRGCLFHGARRKIIAALNADMFDMIRMVAFVGSPESHIWSGFIVVGSGGLDVALNALCGSLDLPSHRRWSGGGGQQSFSETGGPWLSRLRCAEARAWRSACSIDAHLSVPRAHDAASDIRGGGHGAVGARTAD